VTANPGSAQRRIALPMPSSSQSLRAASTTPSSNTRSISISGTSRRQLTTASPASSTRLMLLIRRFSPSRSTWSARPKLCTTRASARFAAAFHAFSASA